MYTSLSMPAFTMAGCVINRCSIFAPAFVIQPFVYLVILIVNCGCTLCSAVDIMFLSLFMC